MSGPHQQQCRIVHLLITLLTLLSLFHTASALEVTPSSPCSNFCIDRSSADPSDALSSATFTKDLSCLDSDYNGDNSTAIGRKFRTCVACEQTSGARAKGLEGEGNENDVYWFLCESCGLFGSLEVLVMEEINEEEMVQFQNMC